MSDNEKKIKLSFDLDTTTFMRVKTAIGELKTQLQGLVDLSTKFGTTLIGANVKGMPSSNQSSTSSMNTMASGAGNNVVSGIGRTVAVNRDMLREVGKSASDAMSKMSKDLESSVKTQIKNLRDLQTEVSKTQAGFSSKARFGYSFGPTSEGAAMSSFQPEMRGPVYGVTSNSFRGGFSGQDGRRGYAMWGGGEIPNEVDLNQSTEKRRSFMSTWRPALGVAGGALMATAAYWDQEPFETSRMAAQSGSRFGSIGMGLRGLSAEGAKFYLATRSLSGNQDYLNAVSAASAASDLMRGKTSGMDLEDLARGAGKLTSNFGSSILGALGNPSALANLNPQQLASKMSEIPLEFVQNEIQANPWKYAGVDRAFNGVDERRRSGRALGLGGGWSMRTMSWNNPVMDMETRLSAQGYGLGDAIAAQNQIAGVGGVSVAKRLREKVMHYEGGLFSGAGRYAGAVEQIGQSGSDALSRMSGSKYDQGVASTIAGYVANQILQGGTAFDANRAFGQFGPPQGSSGQQMWAVQGQIEAMNRVQNDVFGGGRDAYQKAMNFRNARLSGANGALANVIAKDPAMMNVLRDVAAGGAIPSSYAAIGLNKDIANKYLTRELSTQFRNAGALLGTGAKDTAAGKLIADMREGNYGSDFAAYARDKHIIGDKGKVLDAKRLAEMRAAVGGIVRTEYSGERALTERQVDQEFAAALGLSSPRALGKGGSRETGGASQDAKTQEARAQNQKEIDELAKKNTFTPDDFKKAQAMGKDVLDLGSKLNKTVNDTDEALGKFMKQINLVTDNLKEVVNPALTKIKAKGPGGN